MSITTNLNKIKKTIPNGVTLVVVSKQKPLESIAEAYETGERIFAENRHKELIEKCSALPKDIEWHFIGTLQRSNVKYVVPHVALIQSVDSAKLLREIDKESAKIGKSTNVLLEIYIAKDITKTGWDKNALIEFFESGEALTLNNINICGVMGMATYRSDSNVIKAEFEELTSIFNTLKSSYFKDSDQFKTISAGMSGDYPLAIEAGANMVRVGSSIFAK